MKRILPLLLFAALASASAFAQPTQIAPGVDDGGGGGGGGTRPGPTVYQLTDHHGPRMPYAKVVYIFWGTLPYGYAAELQAYRDLSGGMTSHMGMLGQYGTPQGSLTGSQADVFDPSEPPLEVTDGLAQAEVAKYFAGRYDNNAIYLVVFGDGHYLVYRDGETSCGGPSPFLCAYHESYRDAASNMDVKYAVIPFASCDTCKFNALGVVANDVQNAEIVTIHEVREAITDPVYGATWIDQADYEADDKCSPFASPSNVFYIRTPAGPLDTPYWHPGHTYFFQKEWSNSARGCVN